MHKIKAFEAENKKFNSQMIRNSYSNEQNFVIETFEN